jgi:phosphoribosylamine--glycine ligase
VNVLLLGSGGREHAIAWKLKQSPLLKKLYAAPGSDAIGELAENVKLDANDPQAVASFCKENKVGLLFIGPEGPLAAGVADAARASGIPVFGPDKKAAQLEASKAHAKDFMRRHKLPTAKWEKFTDYQLARGAVEAMRLPVVIKADGLAAGKGVVVAQNTNDALGAVTEFMERGALGGAGRTVVVERCLQGPELSVLAFCDGKRFELLPFSRDHKRLNDSDEGPNTGGMGAYAPVELEPALYEAINRLLDQILIGLQADGLDYRGVLYTGLMLTAEGPQVLEFNCRFGDPETQALLPLLEADLLKLALECAQGELKTAARVLPGACLCVTLASPGYPSNPVLGKEITGLDAPLPEGTALFHAGTKKSGQAWTTSGGRVLSVSARGKDLDEARQRAYAACERIKFDGMHYRRDIAR